MEIPTVEKNTPSILSQALVSTDTKKGSATVKVKQDNLPVAQSALGKEGKSLSLEERVASYKDGQVDFENLMVLATTKQVELIFDDKQVGKTYIDRITEASEYIHQSCKKSQYGSKEEGRKQYVAPHLMLFSKAIALIQVFDNENEEDLAFLIADTLCYVLRYGDERDLLTLFNVYLDQYVSSGKSCDFIALDFFKAIDQCYNRRKVDGNSLCVKIKSVAFKIIQNETKLFSLHVLSHFVSCIKEIFEALKVDSNTAEVICGEFSNAIRAHARNDQSIPLLERFCFACYQDDFREVHNSSDLLLNAWLLVLDIWDGTKGCFSTQRSSEERFWGAIVVVNYLNSWEEMGVPVTSIILERFSISLSTVSSDQSRALHTFFLLATYECIKSELMSLKKVDDLLLGKETLIWLKEEINNVLPNQVENPLLADNGDIENDSLRRWGINEI